MFNVKICGIRSLEDLASVLDAGADAIGLNFYSKSKRFVSRTKAQEIAAAAAGKVMRVGLVVNLSPAEVSQVASEVSLDAIQAHGDEDAKWFEAVRKLRLPLIRAIRCPSETGALQAEVARVPPDAGLYDALLIDGAPSGSIASGEIYGGSGATANWQLIGEIRESIQSPLILAGGLTPENVRQAIGAVSPTGVDVASGVEGDYGEKDAAKAATFVVIARESLGLRQV